MNGPCIDIPVFVGQLEKDVDGYLRAAVYRGDPASSGTLVTRERVPSLRVGKRRLRAMVMEQVDLGMKGLRWPSSGGSVTLPR